MNEYVQLKIEKKRNTKKVNKVAKYISINIAQTEIVYHVCDYLSGEK